MLRRSHVLAVAVLAVAACTARPAAACPFCSAVQQTFCEEIRGAQVAVFAKMITVPASEANDDLLINIEPSKAKFEIIEVLKGAKPLRGGKQFETIYFGDRPVGTVFLVTGINPPVIEWSTPVYMTDRTRKYIIGALKQPRKEAKRLLYFQDHLEDEDEAIKRDSYDEFATMSYKEITSIKDELKHDQLVKWIKHADVTPSHRRLYLTLLGLCGTKADTPLLEKFIRDTSGKSLTFLDATIACYLTLKGAEGLPLIEERFLKNPDAEYSETYAAIMALRFHGENTEILPKKDLLAALRHILDRPKLADTVILDLARWQDWSVKDRLLKLFKDSAGETSWVRVPIVNYFRACPDADAKTYLDQLREIDPNSVKQAEAFSQALPDAGTPGGSEDKTGGSSQIKPTSKPKVESDDPAKPARPPGKRASARGPDGKLIYETAADESDDDADDSDVRESGEQLAATGPRDSAGPSGKSTAQKPADGKSQPKSAKSKKTADGDDEDDEPAAASPGSRRPTIELTQPMVVAVPMAAAVVLFALYWMILRVPSSGTPG